MQSDKRNTRVKYILLCALASVSVAAIAGDRTGISVYGYSTDQGYQRQIYGGGNGVYQGYYQPPYYSPLPTVDINRPITAATRKVITTGTIKGSITRASPGTARGSVIGAIRIEIGRSLSEPRGSLRYPSARDRGARIRVGSVEIVKSISSLAPLVLL